MGKQIATGFDAKVNELKNLGARTPALPTIWWAR